MLIGCGWTFATKFEKHIIDTHAKFQQKVGILDFLILQMQPLSMMLLKRWYLSEIVIDHNILHMQNIFKTRLS